MRWWLGRRTPDSVRGAPQRIPLLVGPSEDFGPLHSSEWMPRRLGGLCGRPTAASRNVLRLFRVYPDRISVEIRSPPPRQTFLTILRRIFEPRIARHVSYPNRLDFLTAFNHRPSCSFLLMNTIPFERSANTRFTSDSLLNLAVKLFRAIALLATNALPYSLRPNSLRHHR